ncbi:Ig-like domain-containing protein [Haloferula sp. BvORR071]|uniref:Ig-like domain-containing protein n=1 Tax=Haloferula sp. BvORR071 TaxID=1396141 RepID=UPI00054D179E|nr:Ig-like domain-containing protein [Haloferula sp. BvORR071]
MDLSFRFLPLLAFLALAGPAAADSAPTLTTISDLTGGNEDGVSSIPFATLLSASNAADVDNDTISFRFKSSINGTLRRNGNTVDPDDTLNSGQTWNWTPPNDANGLIDAFRVRAYAAGVESSTDIIVKINVTPVNDPPTFTKGPNVPVLEDSGAYSSAGWATVTSKGAPNESGQTVQFVIVSNSDSSLFSVAPAVSPSGTLTFTPGQDKNGSATIVLKLTDNGGTANGGDNESATQSFTINIAAVPDPPVLGGVFKGTAANPFPDSAVGEAGSPAAGDPFSQLTISDPDDDNQTVTVTISNTADLYGTFALLNSSSVTNASDTVYTLSNLSPALAQSRLRAATFTPKANAQPVGIYNFAAKVEVSDSTARTATPISGSLNVESINDAPIVAASLTNGTVSDSGEVSPFRLSVSDPDPGESFSVTIAETSPTPRGTLIPPTNPMTGTAEGVSAAMSAVRFQPQAQSATQVATFAVNVSDVHPSGSSGTPVSKTLSLTITFSNDPPQISGTATEVIRTTDDPSIPPVFPFSTVTITDADPGQSLTLTLALDDPAKGSFSGDFNALNQLVGTAPEITAKLREVSFRPATGRIPLNQSETATLTITVSDGTATRNNNLTKVEVTSINGAPAVTWNVANGNSAGTFPLASNPAKIDPVPSAKPFEKVGIVEDGQVVVTIKIDSAAKGQLQNLNGFVESPGSPGTYTYTGPATDAQTKIRAIVFVPSETYIFPPNQPGRTDFTISASDSALNLTSRLLPIVLISDTRNFMVTSLLDDPAVPGTLRHAVANAKNDDVITFALPSYPAVIRLSKARGPLVLDKHLSFRGPGADKLTLSGDSNGNSSTDSGDVQIFRVFAGVQIKGLRLARGFAITGGAAYVGRLDPSLAAGSLTLEDCTIANCMASQWGGAIDVEEGTLNVDRCLFESNTLHPSSGLGGGAVSLYTEATCTFLNSTFSGNAQSAPTGYGGGAIYAENFSPNHLFQTKITHCTFAENSDAANKGSAIHSNVSNTRVILSNDIFGDVSAHNLQVAGGGEIQSLGGNLSRDNTTTTFIQAGVPQQAILLNHATDKRSLDPKLASLGTLEGPSRGYRLLADSPAIGTAIPGQAMVDQRGVIRNASADIGAVDANALGKIVIHEIFASQTSPAPQFIEFYNPRDQAAVDLSGFEVWIDGLKRHVFAAGQIVRPGFGVIVADTLFTPANANTPVVLPSETAISSNLDLALRGRIELRAPTADGAKTVESVNYVGIFVNSASPSASLDFDLHSLTLAPQFQGAAFVPHGLVQPPPNGGVITNFNGAKTSPGADSGGTPFGEANAYPIAVADLFEVTEDELSTLNVLTNDLDSDGSDKVFAVDLNAAVSVTPPTSNKATLTTPAGATVSITPATGPLRGTALGYDPRTAFNYLPAGARVTDTFAYTIIDVGSGAIGSFADGGAGTTVVSAPSHRLAAGEMVIISGAGPAAYNGTFSIALVDGDSFRIPVPFTVNPPVLQRGRWQAVEARTPSARDEALVQVEVLGRNDPPAPAADLVTTTEETVLRILADPGSGTALDTDALYPLPRQFATAGILANDSDPDTNDQPYSKLRVVGVCQATAITGYSGTPGSSPVTVTAPAHGLATGTTILISGYGGHTSYNGYQVVTVAGPDTFTIPVTYVDNSAAKGLWTVLTDANRLTTTSVQGAAVTLEIRANRAQTNIVFNPRPSTYLNGLANGESATDSFYYAVEDNAGAVSLAKISVNVTGVNDAPVPVNDPPGLGVLTPLLPPGQTLPAFTAASEILYVLPSSSTAGSLNVAIRPPGGATGDVVVIPAVAWTPEDVALSLPSATLLANDADVDRSDVLRLEIGAGQNLSREGAAISLSGNGATLTYNPTAAPKLQALAFKERVIDTFNVTVFDGIARVNVLVAVLVEGRNDKPIASNATFTTPEKNLLTVNPPGLLTSGLEIDQNTHLPDNRKFLLPVADASTTVSGAKVNVLLESRQGSINGFAAVSGAPGVTKVLAPAHGLQSGEEVVLPASGALTGQYVLTRIDADSFSVPVAWNAGFSSLAGNWRVLASTFQYDPRGSIFPGPTGGPAFTLQGLAQGQTYNDTFTYTLLDGSFLFANDDIYRIEADRSAIELRVLDNDTSLDGVATSRKIVSVGPPNAGGIVTMNGDQSLIYTPEVGFVGDEVFTYTIEDSLGNRDTALVTARVTVDRLNGNLRANADRFTVAAGQSPLLDVLANDSIIPATGDPLTLVSVSTAPDHAGAAVVENGRIRYTPSASAVSFPYTETFAYTMSGGGTTTATATVSVVVENRVGTLNVRADSFGVAIGSSQVTLNVLENDNILPGTGDALTITSVTAPTYGSVSIANGVALSYTAPAGFLGNATFSYTAADGFGGTGTAQVTVKVGYLTTNTDIFSVHFDDAAKSTDDGVTILDVLANDHVLQAGAGAVTITQVTPASSSLGQMSITPGGGSLSFDPAVGATGQRDFTYTISDASGRTATGTVTVVVIANGIRASSDFYTVQTDSQQNQLPVLANDLRISDIPGDLSVAAIGTGPNAPDHGGTVEMSEDFKRLIYTPAQGFSGTETFTCTVTDGDSSDTARVTVRVTTGEMVAGEDEYFAFRGSSANRLAVLDNDRVIPDAGQLLLILATGTDPGNLSNPPHRGTLDIIEGGAALSYTPSPDNTTYPYVETFTYEISSGGSARAAAVVRIEVLDRVGSRNLETNNDSFAVRADSLGTLLPVLANDSVLPASAANWIISDVTVPTSNVCSPFVTGDFPDPATLCTTLFAQGTPLTQFLWTRFAPASRSVFSSASSSDVQRRVALVTEFNAIAKSPASIYDSARFAGITLRDETQALLGLGAAGEQLIVLNRLLLEDAFSPAVLRRAAGGGSVQIVGTNLIYVPQPGFVGSVRFTYRVSDGLGGTGSGEVTVRVGDISVSDDLYTVLAGGGAVALNVTANDGVLRTAFPASQQAAQADFTLTPVKAPTVDPVAAGAVAVTGDVVTFTPASNFQGKAAITYWVEDDGGCTYPGIATVSVMPQGGDRSSAVATVTVTGINDPPQLLNADPSAVLDTGTVRPFANATVVEFDEQRQQLVTLTITYPPGQGVLGGGFTILSPGVLQFQGTAAQITAALRALVFTPVNNRIPVGTTENTVFAASMNDGFVGTPVVVNATTTVTPVNDPPVITGIVGGQKLYQYSSLRPFAGVNITDIDNLGVQTQTVTVSLDNAIKGGFSNLGGFVQTPAGSGSYVFTGTPAASAAALRGLLFTPTPGTRVTPTSPETVTFTLSVNDGFAAAVVNAGTTVQVLHGEVDKILPLATGGADASQVAANFGSSVAISGNTMVVGSPARDGVTADIGRAYVYERNAGIGLPWGQVAQFAGSDSVAGDRFGESVAIDGNLMVVGAPGADAAASNAGAAYVFQRDGANPNAWNQVAKILPPAFNSGGGDSFGSAVAISNMTILVGAPNANLTGAPRSGRAFIFGSTNGTTWISQQTLVAAENKATGQTGDSEMYGASVTLEGNTAVIGSPGANAAGGASTNWNYGAAYIYTRPNSAGTWTELKRLDEFLDVDGTNYAGFGFSVDLSGDRLALGVYSGGSPIGTFKAGGARIYERNQNGANQWGLVQKFTPGTGIPSTYFGYSVAISGELLMIGSPGSDSGSVDKRGYVEVHRRRSTGTPAWLQIDRFVPSTSTATADRFGNALAMDGFSAVAGAADDSVNPLSATTAGSARAYQFQYDLGPRLTLQVPDQLAQLNTAFQFTVNPATFDDPIYPGSLTLSLRQSDGNPLPAGAWLSFNAATGAFTGTPTAANRADYQLVLTATNPLGSTVASNVFRIQLPPANDLASAYTAWAAGKFTAQELGNAALAATVWGMDADPDKDGNSNVVEMLFATNPKQADNGDLAITRVSPTSATLTFTRSGAFPLDAVHVQWSGDMTTWDSSGVVLGSQDIGGGNFKMTATITLPAPRTKLVARVNLGP